MKMLAVTQNDGSVWGVPVDLIARDRAKHYASEFGGDEERSLAEDTLPLFEFDPYEVQDWAVNQMNWSDFAGHEVKLKDAPPPDFQDAWMSGAKTVMTYNGHSAYFCATCYRSTVDVEPTHSCRAMAFVNRLLDPEDLGMAPRDEIRKAAVGVIG